MPRTARPTRGFTLIETALAIVVIGVGVLALLSAQVAFHQQNRWSTHASRAMWLANEIREGMMGLPRHDPVTGRDAASRADPETGLDLQSGEPLWGPEENEFSPKDWDDLDDFDGAVFSGPLGTGPVDASRRLLAGLGEWIQQVQVFHVEPFDVNEPAGYFATELVQVEVTILLLPSGAAEPVELTRLQWLAP